MSHSPLTRILPTRVRRNYLGGLQLDRLSGLEAPQDGNKPESWLASTVRANNPGMPPLSDEGLTRVITTEGSPCTLEELFVSDSRYQLGLRHSAQLGPMLGFLAKLLDSSIRLHVQVHPTAAFAREHLGSPFGKLEVYYVLAVRDGCDGYVRLGFQRPPTRSEWKRIILDQDIEAMDACFDRIPVRPGEVWLVPGGMPHAIGEGVLMVEVMEPSDLVVRCEFEREGVVVPPEARFMGRDPDFCLNIFDYTARSAEDIREHSLIAPLRLQEGPGWALDRLVGPLQTPCFEMLRYQGHAPMTLTTDDRCTLLIATSGILQVQVDGKAQTLHPGDACLSAAGAGAVRLIPLASATEVLLCKPLLRNFSH